MRLDQVGLVVSGHRELADGDDAIIRESMAEFIDYNEFDYFMFGGARGTDTLALAAALDLRGRSRKPLQLIVVVPDTLAEQPRETWSTSERADRIIELQHPITHTDNFRALHRRNEFMINWAAPEGRLLAFWNGTRSGTANAINYARSQGMEVSTRSIKSAAKKSKPAWAPVRT